MEPTPPNSAENQDQESTFIPEQSTANFRPTERECALLDNLFQWQESSSKSTIVLGKPLKS